MFNPSIKRLILGKPEKEAKTILSLYKCKYRVVSIDGNKQNIPDNRDDNRYSLYIRDGKIEAVMPG